MWIILDLMVIAIVLIYVIVSAKRGFVRTLIELVGFGLSIYLSFLIGGAVANGVYDTVIEPSIVDTVVAKVDETATGSINDAIDAVWESVPKTIEQTAQHLGITPASVKNSIDTATLDTTAGAQQVALEVTDAVARPVIVPLIKTLVAIVLFIVLMFVVKLLAKVINRAFSLPLIGGLNRTLGGLLGFAKGLIVAAVVCILLSTIVAVTTNGFLFFTAANIERTALFKLLAGFSPLF